MNHLGIDISKVKFDVCLIVDTKTKVRTFDNTIDGFKELMQWLDGRAVHVCMEGTGRLWEPLAEFLYGQNVLVSVVNPAKIKGFAQSELRRSKTDKIDAKIIGRFCRSHVPSAWVPPPAETKAIRDRQRYIEALKDNRIQENNRLKSGVLDPLVEASILRHIDYLDEQIKTMEKEMLAFIQSHGKLEHEFRLLTSIIGVGQTTAVTFLGELSSATHFANGRELEVFCGIAPRLFESGSSIRSRTKMSKVGNSRMRRALYMPAVCALRTNPVLRDFALRLKSAGKPGKVVVCAVMRKLLRIMFAVLKSGKPFDLEFKSTRLLANPALNS